MLREGIGLSGRQRAILYGCCALLFLTGVAWLVAHTWMRTDGEFGETPHPLEHWSLQLHGAGAMLFLMALGSLVRGHMRIGWKTQRSRPSGVTMVAASVALVATGWCLYYVGNEAARTFISQLHWGLGLAGPVVIGVHVLGRRRGAISSEGLRSTRGASGPGTRDASPGRGPSSSSHPAAARSSTPACTAS